MTTLITPLPTPPTRQDSSNFNDRADEFLGALPLFQQEANGLAIDVQSSADEVEIARQAVVSVTNITKWVSGNTYLEGSSVWSPINGVAYRKVTTSIGGTIDPSIDNTNYKSITDAAGITYTPAGTVAVATTVERKLQETVSVFDFMTSAQIEDVQAGTLSVDVTSAIQSALDGGGAIYLPPGKYRISSSLTIKGDTLLFGAGSGATVLKWFGGTAGDIIIRDSSLVTSSDINKNITLKDFELDCNSYVTGTTYGIKFYRTANVRCENLYVHHCGVTLLQFSGSQDDSKDIWITNCRVEYARIGDGINGVATDVFVSDCKAFSCGDTCFAMLFDNNPSTNTLVRYPQNINYSNCIAKGEWVNGSFTGSGRQEQLGFALGPYAVGKNIYCTVESCTCENLYTNVWMSVFAKFKLIGNTFKSHSNLETGGVRLDGIQNAVITGNSFESSYAGASTYYSSLVLFAQRNVYGASTFDASNLYTDITGNVFEHSSTPAVIFAADPAYAVITDAVLSNNVFAGATKPVQFLPLTSSGTNIFNRVNISNNTVDSTATTFVVANGVRGQYSNIRLSENVIGSVPITSGQVENFQISGGYVTTFSAADGVPTTVFALGEQKTVQIEAYVVVGDIKYSSIGVFVSNFGQSRIAWKSDGANCALTLSGNNVQVTQSGIGTQTVFVKLKYIS